MAEAVEEKTPVVPVGMPMKMVLILVGTSRRRIRRCVCDL